MEKAKKLAIIPARGGSKRIPGKNINDFLGKPILAYSIDIALKSKLFDMVMVSTDSEEIAKVAEEYGAQVPFMRSHSSADDISPLSDVIDEVENDFKKKGISFDYICCILPTAPLIQKKDLENAFELMIKEKYSSVRPVVQYSFPVQRAFKLHGSRVEFLYPENRKVRSQDLEQVYHDAGQFYWINTEFGLLDENRGAIVIPEIRAQDIDNEQDWKLAELKYKQIKQN